MKAVRISEAGGPDVIRVEDVAAPAAGPGEIVIRQRAIGVNFIDTYHRTGLYPIALPSGLGLEGAGDVIEVGAGVERFKVGDRAGFCSGPIGAYAEMHAVPAARAVKIPEGVSDGIAAASMLKGMTARYLLKRTFPLKPGEFAVIHAAAGGVGQIAVQWAKHIGAVVIAVVGSAAKGEIVKALGADHVIDSSHEDIAKRVREITSGEGAHVSYDGVGKDTFNASLDCLRPLGMFVSFGNASGPAPAFEPGILAAKGSLFFTRPTLFTYTRTPELLQETADDLFDVIAKGIVKIAAPTRYALADAAQAHRDLEARKTTGSLVLTP
ncbi:MAG: quinone oxidoreductase [Hyphomonadaceae bacterium]|nr:MAG: NADPH2:quinone reductase [Caulobacteraceae bacterium]MBT9446051.1 quinone oxidoreductase [Hyphomonadaceae bacterium]TPW06280.1 MAG: NADPH2:quinone reductase [Alphaproteobacteria bacterium]